jgi:hypothetical protein
MRICIKDPFAIEDILPEPSTTNEKYELIELSCDGNLQQVFKEMDLTEFWLARRMEYRLISDKAVNICWYLALLTFVNVDFLQ